MKNALLILSLLALAACSSDFTFVHITDTQIGFDNNKTFELDSVNCMAAAELINAISPDFVINTGDLVDNPSDDRQQKAYGAFVASIDKGIGYYALPGNHDIRGGARPDCDRFAFVHKRTGFLGFDSNVIKAGESDAEKAQFEWMDAELDKMSGCRRIFLFCHIPLVLQSIDEEEDYHNFPKDLRQKYLDLFKKHNVTVLFCGHLHRRLEVEIDGIRIISSGATGIALSKSTKVGIARIKVNAKGYEYEYLDTDGMYPVIEKFIADSWDSYVEKTDALPYPYLFDLNPGTLYYWGFYFHNEGLMRQGRWDIAKNNVDDMIYQIEKLGFIPNANGWGENRSMTPVFTMGVRRFYESVPRKDKEWLRKAYDASLTEYEFWTNGNGNRIEDHSTPIEGLQRYGHHADTVYLEQFFKGVVKGRFGIKEEIPREEQIAMSAHRLAEAECQDFTPRFEGRCMDYIPVDLNSIIYGMEMDLAYFERELGISDGKEWEAKAKSRADLINKYCWSEERGMFMDYDFVNQRHSPIASTATFLPMKLGFATGEQSERIVSNLDIFMSDAGVVVCEKADDGIHYQWGYGAVWAPVQMWVMDGLLEAGYTDEARDIAGRWLKTVAANFQNPDPATHRPFKYGDGTRHPGALYEKYTRTGTINDDEYPCSVMLGWTASGFLTALEVYGRKVE